MSPHERPRRIVAALLAALALGTTIPDRASAASNPDGTPIAATTSDPFRFLLVPVRGAIGVDVTASGVETCLALARSEGWDAVLLEFDATRGSLDDGLAIANAIRMAADDLRTIALIRTAGGAAIPPLLACEEWLVLEEIEIRERDDRGIVVMRPVGADRRVIETLPTWGGDAESVVAEMNAMRVAGRRSMPRNLSKAVRDGRAALLDALVDPTLALRIDAGDDAVVRTIPAEANDDATIPTDRQGPGILASQLDDIGLATMLPVGLEPLRMVLGVEAVEPQADTGVVLIGSDADERFARRGGLSRQVDQIFTVVDAVGSLTASLPWSVERARLAAPDRLGGRGRYPMVLGRDGWRLSPEGEKNWTIACDQCLRRWNGVANTTRELLALEERGRTLLEAFEPMEPLPEDVARHAAAVRTARAEMASMASLVSDWRRLAETARVNIERIEAMKSSPPRAER